MRRRLHAPSRSGTGQDQAEQVRAADFAKRWEGPSNLSWNPGDPPPAEYLIAKLEAIENPTEADKAALEHARAELASIRASNPKRTGK